VTLTLDDNASITAHEIIVATGRVPNTRALGLEAAGLETDPRGFLQTNDALRVAGSDWAYAVGDVTGRSAFTHTAAYHAFIAAGHISGDHSHCVEDLIGAPRVTFCSPQVAAVGHTEDSARAAGIDIVIVDRDLSRLAASSFHGRGTPGTARAIFDRASTHMIGATIVGDDIADLLHPATVAILGNIPLNRLRHAVAPFPSRSEIWTAIAREADQLVCG
jgi:dihydrolipoamide dehydrogenase